MTRLFLLELAGILALTVGLVGVATRVMLPASHFLQQQAGDAPALLVQRRWVWLYAVLGLLWLLPPAPLYHRLTGLVMLGFLLQLSVIDSARGWLPREFTVRCGLAGTLVSLSAASALMDVLLLMASIGVPVLIFGGVRWLQMRRMGVEALGLGDVYLAGALGAWLGPSMIRDALLLGLGAFTVFLLWQRYRCRHLAVSGAPLGPWLCGGAVMVTLVDRYAPLLPWAV